MSSLANDIQADKKFLKEMLSNKYEIDYFQRDYKWERKHVEQLIVDLEASFMSNYENNHSVRDVANYNCYYMGPIIVTNKGNTRSIVDGQQRLTSITLLLIYLYNLQKETDLADDIRPLIYSKKHGQYSFNIENNERTRILQALFYGEEKDYDWEDEKSESPRNIYDRYCDIVNMYPDSLKGERMSLFIDWLREKVVFVEILAYSEENAYSIFETMNDRGLNLTPTEMMKGYILSNIQNEDKINEANDIWRKRVSELHRYSWQEDLEFIRAWLRSMYAQTIRPSSRGAENEDFEKIGTRFHTWVRDNSKRIGLKDHDSFYYFIKGDFDFYAALYMKIKNAEIRYTEGLERLYLISNWSIASSLTYPLLMSSISKLDDEKTIINKLAAVSKFLDIFSVTRILNGKSITQTVLRYTFYSFLKELRNKTLEELREMLKDKLRNTNENLDLIVLDYSYSDRKFIQYLFARIIFYLEDTYKKDDETYWIDDLLVPRKKDRYVLAPIIQNNIQYYDGVFANENELSNTCALLGNYVLIPKYLEEKFNSIHSIEKLDLLLDQNLLASLARNAYKLENGDLLDFGFEGIQKLNTENIIERTNQIFNIIREIWNIDMI